MIRVDVCIEPLFPDLPLVERAKSVHDAEGIRKVAGAMI